MAGSSAAGAGRDTDIQGIQWRTLNVTRDEYRKRRIERMTQLWAFGSAKSAAEDCKWRVSKGGKFYTFKGFERSVQSSPLHYQVRNLVWATSNYDVYTTSNNSVFHWSTLDRVKSQVLDVSEHVVPTEEHPSNLVEGFTDTQVSTIAVKDTMLIVGGSRGQLIVKNLHTPGVSYCARTAPVASAQITTAIEFYTSHNGALHFIASSNDGGVTDFDLNMFQVSNHFSLPWPVNHASMSPDGKCLLVVGDNNNSLLVDALSGKTIHTIKGHFDYGSASAWDPKGIIFATGNQDKTCRIWDIRNLAKSSCVLKGNVGAIQSLRFTSKGRYMAMAESSDYIHIYDVSGGFIKEQEIDFFGGTSGMCFSPNAESLFFAVTDTYGCLFEFRNTSFDDNDKVL